MPHRAVPAWIGWLALVAFGLRALVPLGFEPDAHALALVLCHEGFPSGFFSHRGAPRAAHRPQSGSDSHCLFCNSTSPAPAYALAGLIHRAPFAIGLAPLLTPSVRVIRLAHTPQARAPPSVV